MWIAELLLHPVRLRIVQVAMDGAPVTTSQLCARLPDVSKATVYRQVALLADGGLLEVVREQRVRGAVERSYRLHPARAVLDPASIAAMTTDDHRRGFAAAVASLLAEFELYLDQPDADPLADGVSYRQFVLWLSPAEKVELVDEVAAAIRARAERGPAPGRERHLLSTILFPSGYPSGMADHDTTVRALLERAGTTYAEQAGIHLQDTPAPLYRLLVFTTLASSRVRADLAAAATMELLDAGLGTPEKMLAASERDRIDALDRAHYTRYDDMMAEALGAGAELVRDTYGGDLRRLRDEADGDPERVRTALTAFPRIGPVGADIFCREAQAVWPSLRPALDDRCLDGARALGLPADAAALAGLVADDDLARLAAALVRVALDEKLAAELH